MASFLLYQRIPAGLRQGALADLEDISEPAGEDFPAYRGIVN
jgi:hypothetical protein